MTTIPVSSSTSHRLVAVISVTVLLIFAAQAAAQNCEAILGYVRDVNEQTRVERSYSSFKRFFCDQTFSSYQQARDAGFKIGVVVDELPVSFEGHDRSSQWSQYQRSICENVETQSSLYLNIRSYVTSANEKVVDAWAKCISAPGIHFWAETNMGDPSLVTLVATYNGLQGRYEADSDGLSWTPPDALQCDSKELGRKRLARTKRYINNQRSSVNCTRSVTNDEIPAVKVTLRNAADDRTVSIAPYSPPPMFHEVTTEKSMLCSSGQMINDGILGPGTSHRFHFECQAPGYITRYENVQCLGPCGHAYRDVGIAAQDGYYNNHTMVSIRYFIDDEQATRSFTTTVYYQETKPVCVAHCKGVSPGVGRP